MRKYSIVIAAVLLMAALMTGCNNTPQTETLYSSDTVRVERTGNKTVVYDLAGAAEYSFTSHRVRTAKNSTAAHASTAKTTADTETIKLQTVYGLIILEDKAADQTYYIK